MSKVLIWAWTLILVLSISVVSEAAVQNVKIGGDITSYAFYRNDYDLNSSDDSDNDVGFFSTITRINISADLTDNVSSFILISNERDWDKESDSTGSTDINLDYAYITLKDAFSLPLTLKIGRQEIIFGNAMVVANSGTTSTAMTADDYSARSAFDAIRATLDYNQWIIDLIYSKIDEVYEAANQEDEDLYGVNITYEFSKYDAEAEGYLFVKDADNKDIYTLGTRGSLSPLKNLTLNAELAYQFGDYSTQVGASRDQNAWAGELFGSYTFNSKYEPEIKLGYYYRSGQKANKTTGDYKGWDPMYEDQIYGRIYDYLFAGENGGDNSNVHIINIGISSKPIEALSLNVDYYHYILDESFAAGPHPVDSSFTMTTDRNMGDEVDIVAEYSYTEDVTFGLELNWFFPGDAFAETNNDTANQAVGYVSVAF